MTTLVVGSVLLASSAFTTCAPQPDAKGLEVIRAMHKALESVQRVELSISGEAELQGRRELWDARVRASGVPLRFWARIDGEGEIGVQYSAYTGKTMLYTGEGGKRTEEEVPTHRVVMNWASSPAFYGWQLFFDRDRYRNATEDNVFYVHSEEIDGCLCDLVGLITSVKDRELRTSIWYFWVDAETHLPRAFQLHALARGASRLIPKWIVKDVVLNPQWEGEPFREVPQQVAVRATRPPSGGASTAGEPLKPGDPCPDVEVELSDFKKVKLSSLIKGKTLITFWAPWCGPCIAEMKALSEIEQVKSGELKVLAIGVFDSKQNCRAYAAKERLGFAIAFDPDMERSSSRLASALGVGAIPHAFLFDEKRQLVHHWVGFASKEELLTKLQGHE